MRGRHPVVPRPMQNQDPWGWLDGEGAGGTQAASILESGRGGELSITDPNWDGKVQI